MMEANTASDGCIMPDMLPENASSNNNALSAPPDAYSENENSRGKIRLVGIITALYLSLFVAALDGTIVATAIPTISSQLHSASGYTWIGGAYLLAFAASSPIWAKLSDIWGRKPILLATVMMFFGSSIICALSYKMSMLIVGRALQGTAGGGIIQLVFITISDLFSVRTRSLYLGLTETMWAVAGGVGPILGGALTQLVSWRWIFWINLPFSGTAFVVLLIFLDVHNPRTRMMDGMKAIDWFGSLSILGLTLMLLLGLDLGGAQFAWSSPTVICLIIFGSLMSVVFILSEKRLARYPLMPLGLFSQRSNVASLMVVFMHGFVFIGGEYYLPLYFQSVKGLSPLTSGLLILPISFTEGLLGMATGVVIHRTGRYLELIWIGITLLTIGNGLYIYVNASSSLGEVIVLEFVAGIGSGLLFTPPLIALQAMVSQKDTATATSTFGFVRNLAIAMSVVVGGAVFQNGMDLQAPVIRASGLSSNLTMELSGSSAAGNVLLVGTIADQQQQLVVRQAFTWSLRNMWIMYTCVAGCGIVASAFIARRTLSKEHVETRTGIEKQEVVPPSID